MSFFGAVMSRPSCAQGANGFSLVEMMSVLLIGAVLLTLAVPALSDMLRNNRVLSISNALLGTIHRLQAEAITTGVRTTACSSLDRLTCSHVADWHDGWIVFRDLDADGVRDDDEVLLHAQEAADGRLSAKGNTLVRRYLSYIPSGRSATVGGGLQMGTITVCEGSVARLIVVSASGRPRVMTGNC